MLHPVNRARANWSVPPEVAKGNGSFRGWVGMWHPFSEPWQHRLWHRCNNSVSSMSNLFGCCYKICCSTRVYSPKSSSWGIFLLDIMLNWYVKFRLCISWFVCMRISGPFSAHLAGSLLPGGSFRSGQVWDGKCLSVRGRNQVVTVELEIIGRFLLQFQIHTKLSCHCLNRPRHQVIVMTQLPNPINKKTHGLSHLTHRCPHYRLYTSSIAWCSRTAKQLSTLTWPGPQFQKKIRVWTNGPTVNIK